MNDYTTLHIVAAFRSTVSGDKEKLFEPAFIPSASCKSDEAKQRSIDAQVDKWRAEASNNIYVADVTDVAFTAVLERGEELSVVSHEAHSDDGAALDLVEHVLPELRDCLPADCYYPRVKWYGFDPKFLSKVMLAQVLRSNLMSQPEWQKYRGVVRTLLYGAEHYAVNSLVDPSGCNSRASDDMKMQTLCSGSPEMAELWDDYAVGDATLSQEVSIVGYLFGAAGVLPCMLEHRELAAR